MNTQYEKVPNAPPSYSEVYPSAPNESFANNPVDTQNIGWQPNQGSNMPHQQSTILPMIQQLPQMPNMSMQTPQTIVVYNNQVQVGEYPVTLNPCPHCQQQCMTRIEQKSSLLTHFVAAVFCFICWLPCVAIPYVTNCLKNPTHYCGKCSAYIGTYRRDTNRRF